MTAVNSPTKANYIWAVKSFHEILRASVALSGTDLLTGVKKMANFVEFKTFEYLEQKATVTEADLAASILKIGFLRNPSKMLQKYFPACWSHSTEETKGMLD